MKEVNCRLCHDRGWVTELMETDNHEEFKLRRGCSACAKGTEYRVHIMMHSQDSHPCGCPYMGLECPPFRA